MQVLVKILRKYENIIWKIYFCSVKKTRVILSQARHKLLYLSLSQSHSKFVTIKFILHVLRFMTDEV